MMEGAEEVRRIRRRRHGSGVTISLPVLRSIVDDCGDCDDNGERGDSRLTAIERGRIARIGGDSFLHRDSKLARSLSGCGGLWGAVVAVIILCSILVLRRSDTPPPSNWRVDAALTPSYTPKNNTPKKYANSEEPTGPVSNEAAAPPLYLRDGLEVTTPQEQPYQQPQHVISDSSDSPPTNLARNDEVEEQPENPQHQPGVQGEEDCGMTEHRPPEKHTTVSSESSNKEEGGDKATPSQKSAPSTMARQPQPPPVIPRHDHLDHHGYEAFMKWCKYVMGIQTSLVIKEFDYYDYLHDWINLDGLEDGEAETTRDGDLDGSNDRNQTDVGTGPSDNSKRKMVKVRMVKVRGLAASRNIEIGEVVISIPFHAMITVRTTIDHDPVLSRLLGPAARARFGWDDSGGGGGAAAAARVDIDGDGNNVIEEDMVQYYEIPLLIVALLYHRSLGSSSPLSHYIGVLLSTPVDAMPFLWDAKTLRRDANEGVRHIAAGIKSDIRDMYDAVMRVLIEEYPDVFGRRQTDTLEEGIHGDEGDEEEWMYSYEKFEWGFAMVNSRHWHLPLEDLDESRPQKSHTARTRDASVNLQIPPLMASTENVPPAEQPTEEWVHLQHMLENQDNVDVKNDDSLDVINRSRSSHSFLAPVADLLNFGPPCVRGTYNVETHAFELVSTCPFLAGQEVTFWYTDDCEDVIIANYGFTHPMVARCPSVDDWRRRSDSYKSQAEALEDEIGSAYEEVDRLQVELNRLKAAMKECGCGAIDSLGEDKGGAGHDDRMPVHERRWGHATAVTEEQDVLQQQQLQQKLRRDRQNAPARNEDVGVRGSASNADNGEGSDYNEERGGIRRTFHQRVKSNLGL